MIAPLSPPRTPPLLEDEEEELLLPLPSSNPEPLVDDPLQATRDTDTRDTRTSEVRRITRILQTKGARAIRSVSTPIEFTENCGRSGEKSEGARPGYGSRLMAPSLGGAHDFVQFEPASRLLSYRM